ncbi:MAG: hypothetical protein KDL31_13235 [Kiritimatiellae bacterium]|nr:hypothetical protein [Kiritimatiellia bacterium]
MNKRYEIEVDRTYLYWSIGMLLLGVWAVVDGWFPPPSKLEKYPEFVRNLSFFSSQLDSFYEFNRTLAVAAFIACGVFYSIHRKGLR